MNKQHGRMGLNPVRKTLLAALAFAPKAGIAQTSIGYVQDASSKFSNPIVLGMVALLILALILSIIFQKRFKADHRT
jgi:hypothetical protein